MMLNTLRIGLVYKQHPRDLANVNAWKNMCDPYSGLSILLHDVISLPDATSYDKTVYKCMKYAICIFVVDVVG